MSYVHISRIAPSKYGDGDRWRLEIDGEWYDAYLTPDASAVQPGEHEVEFKTSPKTGKVYAVAIDGRYRTGGGQQRQAAPPARSQAIRWASRDFIDAEPASQDGLVKGITEGLRVEEAREPDTPDMFEETLPPADDARLLDAPGLKAGGGAR